MLSAHPFPPQPCSNGDGDTQVLWDTQKKSKTGSIVVAPAGAYRKAGQPPGLVGLTQPQGRKIHLRSCKGQKHPGHQPQSLQSQQETAGSAHRASAYRLAHGSRFVTSAPKDPAPTPRPRSHWLLSGSAPPAFASVGARRETLPFSQLVLCWGFNLSC